MLKNATQIYSGLNDVSVIQLFFPLSISFQYFFFKVVFILR